MKKLKVCFLGTPEFAVTSLKYLLSDPYYEIVGVVTQPDRPAGRKMQLAASPVKVLASENNLPVVCPANLRIEPDILEQIKNWKAELAIVIAFGQILSEEFLNMFALGAVNIHGSLLPKWRGAAPIQRALQHGDKETGVTLQKIVKQLDAGDVIGVRKIEIADEWNANIVYQKLSEMGTELLKWDLKDFVEGHLVATKQEESQVTIAKKIDNAEGEINWRLSSERIHNQVRGFSMGPGSFSWLENKKIKIHKTKVKNTTENNVEKIGYVSAMSKECLSIQCGTGVLEILEIQPESRNRMPIADFLKSQSITAETRFGK